MSNSDYLRITRAINYLEENFREQPSLTQIAAHVGLSEFHFQKMFTQWAGISPKKFVQYLTVEYLKQTLDRNPDILSATFDSGLSSTSRTHELFVNIEAVSPAEYKQWGRGLEIFYGFHHSPFGICLIAATAKGVCAVNFIEDEQVALQELTDNWPHAQLIHNPGVTQSYYEQIFKHRQEPVTAILKGTPFQIQVWKALLRIPKGGLATYANVANQIGRPNAQRAVGTAIGSNPLGFLIPCHRVINAKGIVGNYRWGTERKKLILGWEAANLTNS
jgi:AraC family transcriptional regulator of adaptative response/methylated-DNA-[protein]-cysteine methyltransferase